jgi:O6-methylguanine-DNA--protein-cysteine methyltransferase
MNGYIVQVADKLFVGIVSIEQNKNEGNFKLYLNTTVKNKSEIERELQNINDIVFQSLTPEYIIDCANKIFLIKQGFDQDTSKIVLDYTGYTEKQIQVIKTAMTIPVNEIWPYSKVAEQAGLPQAQRFVGTTMRILRQPYIVPVHRVKSKKFFKKPKKNSMRSYKKNPI